LVSFPYLTLKKHEISLPYQTFKEKNMSNIKK